MPTTKDLMHYIVDQLNDSPLVKTRAMFGEYALYYDTVVVALICDDTVFLKINPSTIELLGEDYQKGQAYKGSKDFYKLGEEILEDKELFMRLVRYCSDEVKKTTKAKPKRAKKQSLQS